VQSLILTFLLRNSLRCSTDRFANTLISLYVVAFDFIWLITTECITFFSSRTENYWILDLTSFHEKTPAKLNIDALEDSVVLRINHAELIDLYLKAPKFNRIFRVLLESHFMLQQQRMAQLFSSTAEERYQLFLETYPHLLNRLSQVQIAAYLGITPEFLSRIRGRLAKESR